VARSTGRRGASPPPAPRRAGAPGKKPRPVRAPPVAEYDRAVAEHFMGLALREAEKGLGRTSPNPAVGAVLVMNGRVIARGFHARAGGPHAEVVALRAAGSRARGADLYTTLEPCDHQGKTPPCSRAILAAGVRRVFVGSRDPNPLVSGRGMRRLRRAGVPVVAGVLAEACDRVNEGWFKFIKEGRPFVTLKAAITLDGRLATATGDSRWISGEESRALVHRLRDRVDAVIVGRGTVEADDPRLTTRLPEGGGRDAARVILDSRLAVSPRAQVFRQESAAPTLVACVAPVDEKRKARLERAGARILVCRSKGGRVDVADLLARLASLGMVEVLVEGGAEVYGAFLERGLWDRLLLFVAPIVLGAGPAWPAVLPANRVAKARRFVYRETRRIGEDLLVEVLPGEVEAGGGRGR
jgi:diaminohydroxyphosphoribosylaminopyrimidine deaminase/5-amino-6-(5-phosphoribosylamino)uracil reductase